MWHSLGHLYTGLSPALPWPGPRQLGILSSRVTLLGSHPSSHSSLCAFWEKKKSRPSCDLDTAGPHHNVSHQVCGQCVETKLLWVCECVYVYVCVFVRACRPPHPCSQISVLTHPFFFFLAGVFLLLGIYLAEFLSSGWPWGSQVS